MTSLSIAVAVWAVGFILTLVLTSSIAREMGDRRIMAAAALVAAAWPLSLLLVLGAGVFFQWEAKWRTWRVKP